MTEIEQILPWRWQTLAVFAAIALIFSRQPGAFLHSQFFAEDGSVWFADAYNRGWLPSLFHPQDGYFQTLPRLAASLALLVPLARAPAVMNFVGLVVQILPVPILLSRRLAAWGTLPLRAALAFVYLGLPNSYELNVSVEEAQWHLALAACLLLAAPPRSGAAKLFDLVILLLCGLTGPFALLLLPIAGLSLLRKPNRTWWPFGILASTAALQACALLLCPRQSWPLGAGIGPLLRITAGQVFLGTILGSNSWGTQSGMLFLICVVVAGGSLAVNCFRQANLQWKLFLLFSIFVFAASLIRPFTPHLRPGYTAWSALASAPGIRYWFFPGLAFAWTIVWYSLAAPRHRFHRPVAALLVSFLLIGIVRDWRIPPVKDFRFAQYAAAFEASPPGTVFIIPENPQPWTMRLVKH